jgi:ribosome recycling factor
MSDQGEEMRELVIDECQEKMHKAIEHLKTEFGGVRTGRATSSLVDKLRVDYYGTDVPLQQLASFSVPEPRVLVISPYDKGAIKGIERAIQSSDVGITPNNDGVVIRLVFPELTGERRKDLVKLVKHRAEEARVAVRNIRRQARHDLEGLAKDGDLSDDDLKRAEDVLERHTKGVVGDIEAVLAKKEHELLLD